MRGGGLRQDQSCRRFRTVVSFASRGEPLDSRSGVRLPVVPSRGLSVAECAADIPWHVGDPRQFASRSCSYNAPFASGGCQVGGNIVGSPAGDCRAARASSPSGHRAVFCGGVGPAHKAKHSVRACRLDTHRDAPCAIAAAPRGFLGCVSTVLLLHDLSRFGGMLVAEDAGSYHSKQTGHRADWATGERHRLVSSRRSGDTSSYHHDGATVKIKQGAAWSS